MTAEEILRRLDHVRPSGSGWTARCPAHDDHDNSLSINRKSDGGILLKCFRGCDTEAIVSKVNLTMADLFPSRPARGSRRSSAVTPTPVRLEDVAAARGLPVDLLRELGWTNDGDRIRIPFHREGGTVAPRVHVRRALEKRPGNSRFYWAGPSAPLIAYGLDRLADARAQKKLVIAEGETDTVTCWHAGLPALGVPGAETVGTTLTPALLEGFEHVVLAKDADEGGDKFVANAWQICEAARVPKITVLPMPDGAKDINEWYRQCGSVEMFKAAFRAAVDSAPPYVPAPVMPETSTVIEPNVLEFPTAATIAAGQAISQFERLGEGWYRWALVPPGIQFEVDRLRLEKSQWVGELTVRCDLPGARTVDGELPPTDLNFSSLTARKQRASYLQERTNTTPDQIDWLRLLEDFYTRVLRDQRRGEPSLDLATVELPPEDATGQEFEIDGLYLIRDEDTIIFGGGGIAKSLFGVYIGGTLVERGIPTLYCDWEWKPAPHARRLRSLFGQNPPHLHYISCCRPLVAEVDRVRRIVREAGIRYVIIDSLAYASDGAPEDAETVTRFHNAVRSIGVGSLWLAHITKSGDNADQFPFGSVFWSNSARQTWNVQAVDSASTPTTKTVVLYQRKENERKHPPVTYEIDRVTPTQTCIRRVESMDVREVAAKRPIWERVQHAVKHRHLTYAELAEAIDAKEDSIRKAVEDKSDKLFRIYEGADGRKVVSLVEHRYGR